jgi:hypothetical protein
MIDVFGRPADKLPIEVRDFLDNFSPNQKAAIMLVMLLVSKSSSSVRKEEMELLGTCSRLLGLSNTDSTFKRVSSLNSQGILEILNSFTLEQKRWLVFSLQSMVIASGGNDDKFNYALGVCEKIGIPEEKYIDIVKNTQNMMKAIGLHG